jgi:hypothetical protein
VNPNGIGALCVVACIVLSAGWKAGVKCEGDCATRIDARSDLFGT